MRPVSHSVLHQSGYQKERERRSRPKEEHCLMPNLVVEKRASKDRDRSGSSITRPRTGTPMGFVQRSELSSCFYFSFLFSFNVVALTSSRRATLSPYRCTSIRRSINNADHSSHLVIISSPLHFFLYYFSIGIHIPLLIKKET